MNRTLSIPTVSFLRSRQPSLSEINSILEYLPQAAFLLDIEKRQILLANAKAIELSAFTRNELIAKNLEDLLPFLPNHLQEFSQTTKPDPYIDTLTTHSGSGVEVRVHLAGLDAGGVWGLITLEPTVDRDSRLAEKRRRHLRLKDLNVLASTIQETDIQLALQSALETGHHLTGADILVLYLVDPEKPGLYKAKAWGEHDELPEIIDIDEVNVLVKDVSWTPGHRTTNSLAKAARVAKLSYIYTFPLRQEDSLLGFIVLAAYEGYLPEDNNQLIAILSTTITGIIQLNTHRDNLLKNHSAVNRDKLIGGIIIESTQDGIIQLSAELNIEQLNPQAEVLLGYATQEIVGQPVNNILIGPSNLVPVLQAAQDGLATPNLGEVHLHRRDGVAFLAHISTIPLIIEDQVEGVIILIRDLSAHEEYEIRNQQLEQRALLGEVTAIFAHEVRNPINNISTGLQLMTSNLPSDDPNQEVINRLKDDCSRLTDLMQSVLTFSRPPEGKFQKVNLDILLPTLLERWRPRLTRLNIKHDFKSYAEYSTILGDSRSLEQVFSNLIGNAVEAMKSTGGNLSIHIRPSQRDRGRQHIEVNVIDDGPGIPSELINRIFEPFITTNRNGTGLGLSIAKRIVTAHKGTINVSSIPGGTVFQVKFPLSQDVEV